MKKKMQTGKIINRFEQKRVLGGVEGEGGGCPGKGPQTATHICVDGDGNSTGQVVCCKGIDAEEMNNGVHCLTAPPFQTNLYANCSGQVPQ